ncbi:hypothetical protein BKA80DRAFT_111131 [Phyllosticta citrichinensis]
MLGYVGPKLSGHVNQPLVQGRRSFGGSCIRAFSCLRSPLQANGDDDASSSSSAAAAAAVGFVHVCSVTACRTKQLYPHRRMGGRLKLTHQSTSPRLNLPLPSFTSPAFPLPFKQASHVAVAWLAGWLAGGVPGAAARSHLQTSAPTIIITLHVSSQSPACCLLCTRLGSSGHHLKSPHHLTTRTDGRLFVRAWGWAGADAI